jgi:protein-L-isoaspartate(D-aspartate) O-methyltransferase
VPRLSTRAATPFTSCRCRPELSEAAHAAHLDRPGPGPRLRGTGCARGAAADRCSKTRGPLRLFPMKGPSLSVLSLFLFTAFWVPGASGAEAPAPSRPDAYAQARAMMVSEQIEARGIQDPSVLQAMEKVPRHCFVPRSSIAQAYDDHPIPIGMGQTISQPYIVALMTELLELKPSHRVLEVGTGSGYQSAVLSGLVCEVFTVEIYPSLAEEAGARLRSLGYGNVKVKEGDGYFGWSEHAPFDAIVVTAAASEIPPPLLRQLKPGGRMCIPVGGQYQVQQLMVVEKDPDGSCSTRGVIPVRFVPLLGGP